jgi:hypothetical protein
MGDRSAAQGIAGQGRQGQVEIGRQTGRLSAAG